MNSERLAIVDNNNNVIGETLREEIYEQAHHHRIVHVMLVDTQGRILLQKRRQEDGSLALSSSMGGHVKSKESYSVAANRELREEYKIDYDHELKPVGDITFTDTRADTRGMKKFIQVFTAQIDNTLILKSAEAESAHFFSLEEIQAMAEENRELFHPELRDILESFFQIVFL